MVFLFVWLVYLVWYSKTSMLSQMARFHFVNKFQITYLQKRNTNIEKELNDHQGERDRLAVWDWHVPTAIFKIDDQQGVLV